MKRLPKLSARKVFPSGVQYPSEAIEEISCPKKEFHEKTTVEPKDSSNVSFSSPSMLA
jgi:hypothetical protein